MSKIRVPTIATLCMGIIIFNFFLSLIIVPYSTCDVSTNCQACIRCTPQRACCLGHPSIQALKLYLPASLNNASQQKSETCKLLKRRHDLFPRIENQNCIITNSLVHSLYAGLLLLLLLLAFIIVSITDETNCMTSTYKLH